MTDHPELHHSSHSNGVPGKAGRTAEPVELDIRVEHVNLVPEDAPLADDVLDALARAHGIGSV